MKKFTLDNLKKLHPRESGLIWYEKNIKSENILEILLQLNNYKPGWSRWLMVRIISTENRKRLAIFSAESVLYIFEKKFPNDNRIRDCIQASKDYLDGKIDLTTLKEKRVAAYVTYAAAAYAAYVTYAAYVAYVAYAAYVAAYAAAYVAYAADAAYAAAAYAAYAADAAYARKKIQKEIIKKAVTFYENEK